MWLVWGCESGMDTAPTATADPAAQLPAEGVGPESGSGWGSERPWGDGGEASALGPKDGGQGARLEEAS